MDRELIISRLMEEYKLYKLEYDNDLNSKLELIEKKKNKIKNKYNNLQQELKSLYDTVIKKLNAFYDTYDVTITQLSAYKSSSIDIPLRLKATLAEIPKFSLCRLRTTAIDYNFQSEQIILNLNYDIYNTPLSVFALYDSIIERILFAEGNLENVQIKLDKYSNVRDHTISFTDNNGTFDVTNTHFLVINERDIIILYDYVFDKTGDYYVNFIQMSTGKLVYSELVSLNKDDYRPEFIYCNNTIILLYWHTNLINIIPYNIQQEPTVPPVYTKGNKYTIKLPIVSGWPVRFYGDYKGLYACVGMIIYFIGKLQDILCDTFNLSQIPQIPQLPQLPQINVNINKHINRYLILSDIFNINYETYEILLRIYHHGGSKDLDGTYYKVPLGFTDVCAFWYE